MNSSKNIYKLLLIFGVLLLGLAPVQTKAMMMPAGDDIVIFWNSQAIEAFKTAQYTSTSASRVLAMVHVAMFDALNSVDKAYQPYYIEAPVTYPVSREVAVAAAAHKVLIGLFPAQSANLDAVMLDYLMSLPNGPEKNNGFALGQYVANQILALRSNDHSGDMVPYTPGTDPGDWQPTPPAFAPAMMPNWATVTPFAMNTQSQFRTIALPALTSPEYTQDYQQVKEIGNKFSVTRTQEQTDIAMFWVDMPGTITTVGRWNMVAQSVALQKGNNMWQNAQLFAKLNIALADAGIAAWDYKYFYNFWRPITAIRQGNTDGNPATIQDGAWEPLVMTPAFPEYVSAHSCFSGAAAQTLADFFGSDHISFQIPSFMMPMNVRSFASFSQAAEEAGISRVYGGIHFNSANRAGLDSGRAVSKFVSKNFINQLNVPVDNDGIDTDGDGDPDNDIVIVHLAAGDGFVNMADGKETYCFGFSSANGVPENEVMSVGELSAEFPGPMVVFKEGQKVYLSLTNVGMVMRPDLFDAHSVHFHGFPNAAPVFDGVPDSSISINMGGTLTYFYNIVEPGTFMYHCHVEATEHMQMGMLANLYVLPKQNNLADGTDLNGFTHHTGYRYAYNDGDGSTYYDVDYPIQITSFDPAFHDASVNVQPLPFAMMDDRYPMINGRGYPQTTDTNLLANTFNGKYSQKMNALVTAKVGQKILLRISCLSTTRHFTLSAMGLPMKVVGKGARLLRGPDGKNLYYDTTSITLGGGEAADVIVDTANVPAGTYVLYTTNLQNLSNDAEDYGGMMTEIVISE